jgi:hypothetical protein
MRERCEGMSHVLELFEYHTQKVTVHKHYLDFLCNLIPNLFL